MAAVRAVPIVPAATGVRSAHAVLVKSLSTLLPSYLGYMKLPLAQQVLASMLENWCAVGASKIPSQLILGQGVTGVVFKLCFQTSPGSETKCGFVAKSFKQLQEWVPTVGNLVPNVQREMMVQAVAAKHGLAAPAIGLFTCTRSPHTTAKHPLLIMSRFEDGATLADVIKSHPSAERMNAIFTNLTTALKKLHQTGVVHGDLHVNNVWVSTSNAVMFMDFGRSSYWSRVPTEGVMFDVTVLMRGLSTAVASATQVTQIFNLLTAAVGVPADKAALYTTAALRLLNEQPLGSAPAAEVPYVAAFTRFFAQHAARITTMQTWMVEKMVRVVYDALTVDVPVGV